MTDSRDAGGNGGAGTFRSTNATPVSFTQGSRLHFELIASDPGTGSEVAVFDAGGEGLDSDICDGIIHAVRSGG